MNRVRALHVSADKHCQALEGQDAIRAAFRQEGVVWLDVLVKDKSLGQDILRDQLGLHELAVEDALSSDESPSIQEFGETIFLVVRALVGGPNPIELRDVAFFVNENRLITVTSDKVPILDTWFDRVRHRSDWVSNKADSLLHALLDAIVDDYFPTLDELEDQVDETADMIYAGDTRQVSRILAQKRQIILFRRALLPVRDVINGLLRRDTPALTVETRPYFQDVYDHVLRLTELLDVNRDTLASMLDVHLSTVSNNLNEVMKKMTIISTVLMSMALVAGVYGMNFDKMPELHWQYGYLFAWVLMLGSGVLVLVTFRKMKWF